MSETVKMIVKGKVQGVWFRKTTQQMAIELGVLGKVKNKSNGDVEIIAKASQEQMNSFINWVRIGPKDARVSSLTIEYLSEEIDTNHFEISYE